MMDWPKSDILNYFQQLTEYSEKFEEQEKDENDHPSVLAIIVRWIGFDVEVEPQKVYHGLDIGKEGAMPPDDFFTGNVKKFQEDIVKKLKEEEKTLNIQRDSYGITCKGEPVSI